MSKKFYPTRNLPLRVILYLWASPASLLGLGIGLLGFLLGGKAMLRRGSVEFYGGLSALILKRLGGVVAMTLGHTVIGISAAALDVTRDHEQVHVRQYERWGPFFIPAYLASSVWLWWRGADPYRENPFEVEAYRLTE